MKKFLGIVVLGLLWCASANADFYEIEKFNCLYTKNASGGFNDYLDGELKLRTKTSDDSWNIKISSINYKKKKAYLIFRDDVVRDLHIINMLDKNITGFGSYVTFLWLSDYGKTSIITVFSDKDKNNRYISVKSVHDKFIGRPSMVQYYGTCSGY